MSIPSNKRRILIAKVGLDGHDVGARVVARGLSDAGMDVSYTGIRRTPEDVADMAAEFEATVVGVSILSGAHLELLPRLRKLLDERDMQDVALIVGGVIPIEDVAPLKQQGVSEVFLSGSSVTDIVSFVDDLHRPEQAEADDPVVY